MSSSQATCGCSQTGCPPATPRRKWCAAGELVAAHKARGCRWQTKGDLTLQEHVYVWLPDETLNLKFTKGGLAYDIKSRSQNEAEVRRGRPAWVYTDKTCTRVAHCRRHKLGVCVAGAHSAFVQLIYWHPVHVSLLRFTPKTDHVDALTVDRVCCHAPPGV